MNIREISTEQMRLFVAEHHYSTTMPCLTKACYGGFRDESLRAAISFGWGSKPKHTAPAKVRERMVRDGFLFYRTPPKGRYVTFAGDRELVEVLRAELKWEVLPYPKREQ